MPAEHIARTKEAKSSPPGLEHLLISQHKMNRPICSPQTILLKKSHKDDLCSPDNDIIKQLQPGHIHALCLQLVASGIVEMSVNDHTLFVSDKLLKTNLRVKFGKDYKDGTLKALPPTVFEDFQT